MSKEQTKIKVSVHNADMASKLGVIAITHGIGFTYTPDIKSEEDIDEFIFNCKRESLINLADKIFNYTTITPEDSSKVAKYIAENAEVA